MWKEGQSLVTEPSAIANNLEESGMEERWARWTSKGSRG